MKIEIVENREFKQTLYQWDTDRQVKVLTDDGITVDEVHFANAFTQQALIVVPTNGDGGRIANIPNILMQCSVPINVYAVAHSDNGERTVCAQQLEVIKRKKPSDYVYTETELKDYQELEDRVDVLEEQSKEYLKKETDPTVPDWAKQPKKPGYTAEEVGALPDTTEIPSKVSDLENDEKYVKDSDYAGYEKTGVVKLHRDNGILIDNNNALKLNLPTPSQLKSKANIFATLIPSNIDSIVKYGLTDNKLDWTDDERKNARELLGVEEALKFAVKQKTGKAESINITDSADYKILDMELEGKTEQKQYTGKNLYSSVYSDYTKPYDYYIMPIDLQSETTYVASIKLVGEKIEGCNVGFVKFGDKYKDFVDQQTLLNIEGKITNSKIKFTTDSAWTSPELVVFCNGEEQFNEIFENYEIQLEANTETTDYEPYVGKKPSPSPEYPQEIANAGVLNEDTGKYEIECKVANKNLFDESKLSGGEFVDLDGVRCYKYRDYNEGNFSYEDTFKENTQYTFTVMVHREAGFDNGGTGGTYIVIEYTDGTYENIQASIKDKIYTQTSVKGKTVSGMKGSWNEGTWCYLDLSVMQIEEGAKATDYTAPKSQQITLASDRPITKWDKLVKRDGVWGWSIWSEYQNITMENWVARNRTASAGGVFFLYAGFTDNTFTSDKTTEFCTHFIHTNPYESVGDYFYIYNGDLRIGLSDTTITTVEAFVEKLETLGDIGIWHKTMTEEFIPLSDEEQTLLNNLETYYGVTNVYNDQGCPMWIEYVCDTKQYIEQNFVPKSEIEEIKNQLADLQTLVVSNV